MIEVENLSKRYGEKLAVDGLDFVVRPGIVTGFLGPNGAGKSTTMRMIAGLDEPTAGRVRVNGRDYRAALAPMAELGILLEAKAMHTGRSGIGRAATSQAGHICRKAYSPAAQRATRPGPAAGQHARYRRMAVHRLLICCRRP